MKFTHLIKSMLIPMLGWFIVVDWVTKTMHVNIWRATLIFVLYFAVNIYVTKKNMEERLAHMERKLAQERMELDIEQAKKERRLIEDRKLYKNKTE